MSYEEFCGWAWLITIAVVLAAVVADVLDTRPPP